MAVSELETTDSPLSGWGLPRPKRHIPEPIIIPPQTLEEVLLDHRFIDYGLLADYQGFHDKGLDHYGVLGARMIKRLKIKGQPADPKLQADLLVRFIMTKAREDGHNPYQYIAMYQMDHMTWEMAHAGYTEKSDRQRAWDKLMKADRQRLERQTLRRHVRQISTDSSSPIAPSAPVRRIHLASRALPPTPPVQPTFHP